MKNIDLKTLVSKLSPYQQKLRRYRVIIFFVAVIMMYSFLVFRINILANGEPSDSDVDAKLQTSKQLKVDPATIKKIQELQDNSSEVKALFNQARNNPFQE
jgi:hypothetical protein